jgi:hypothetical protein
MEKVDIFTLVYGFGDLGLLLKTPKPLLKIFSRNIKIMANMIIGNAQQDKKGDQATKC